MPLFIRRHSGGLRRTYVGNVLAFGTVCAFLFFSPSVIAAADGADGTGHDGVTGGRGEDGGDGGPFDNGGNGGNGVSLDYPDGEFTEISNTPGVDAFITDLTTLAGINNGDQEDQSCLG